MYARQMHKLCGSTEEVIINSAGKGGVEETMSQKTDV